jgi:hypothetical protein
VQLTPGGFIIPSVTIGASLGQGTYCPVLEANISLVAPVLLGTVQEEYCWQEATFVLELFV